MPFDIFKDFVDDATDFIDDNSELLAAAALAFIAAPAALSYFGATTATVGTAGSLVGGTAATASSTVAPLTASTSLTSSLFGEGLKKTALEAAITTGVTIGGSALLASQLPKPPTPADARIATPPRPPNPVHTSTANRASLRRYRARGYSQLTT